MDYPTDKYRLHQSRCDADELLDSGRGYPENPEGFFVLRFLIKAPHEDVYEEFVEHLATQIAFTNCEDAATYVSTIAYPDKSGLHVPHLIGGSFIEAIQGFGVANQRLAKRRDSWLKKVTSRILDLLALYPKQ